MINYKQARKLLFEEAERKLSREDYIRLLSFVGSLAKWELGRLTNTLGEEIGYLNAYRKVAAHAEKSERWAMLLKRVDVTYPEKERKLETPWQLYRVCLAHENPAQAVRDAEKWGIAPSTARKNLKTYKKKDN